MRYGFSKKPLILKTASGEDIVMYDPECEIAQRFPNLYYLFHEGIQAILEEYGERAEKTLDWFENELQKTIDHCWTDKTVYKWYYGLIRTFSTTPRTIVFFKEYIMSKIA